MATSIVAPGGAPTHPQSAGRAPETSTLAQLAPSERRGLADQAISYVDLLGWISDAQALVSGLRTVADQLNPDIGKTLRQHAAQYRGLNIYDDGIQSAVGHVRLSLIDMIAELGGAA